MMTAWREQFNRDPERAVADLLSGRAGVAGGHLSVQEALFHEFSPDPEPIKEQLGDALVNWLETMRRGYATEVRRLDYAVYALRLCHGFRALQLLQPAGGIAQVRRQHTQWLGWLEPLRMAPERDPALESWRLMSLRQSEQGSPVPWVQLATVHRPEYLAVALAGLQRLPVVNGLSTQVLMLAALLHYCAAEDTPDEGAEEFDKRYAALRARYATTSEAQWSAWFAAAAQSHVRVPRLSRLLDRLRQEDKNPKHKPPVKVAPLCVPPTLEESEAVLNEITAASKHAATGLEEKFRQLIRRHQDYARCTGDSYFFVVTLCNHGRRLLKRQGFSAQLFREMSSWIEEALTWQPLNHYVWMLWADCLSKQGRVDQREWVLRETVRLFPNREHGRVELARLLVPRGQEHWPEAEGWLRQAAEADSRHEHSRVELARLLVQRGQEHWPEAEGWLRQVAESDSRHEHSRVELARLLMRRGQEHWPEAEGWLRQAAEADSRHEHSRVELARLLVQRGQEHWPEAEGWLRQVAQRNPDNAHSRVELAWLLARTGRSEQGQSLLREWLKAHPGNAVAERCLRRLEAGQDWLADEDDGMTGFDDISPVPVADQSLASLPLGAGDSGERSGLDARLPELQKRAQIQSGFASRQKGQEDLPETLKTAANQGDMLAGLYVAWLNQNADFSDPPPNAWAWRAAVCYRAGKAEHWTDLEGRFPNFYELTRYLRWLSSSATDRKDIGRNLGEQLRKYGQDKWPAMDFALKKWAEMSGASQPDSQENSEEIALSLLQAQAYSTGSRLSA